MKNINKLRKEIDQIDNKILNLLKNRSKIAIKIGSLKKADLNNTNLFRPERQVEILNRLFAKKNDFFKEEDIFNFWREVFSHQTNLQGNLEFLVPKFLGKIDKDIIFFSFGINTKINLFEDYNKAFSLVKSKRNKLLILPFPGKLKGTKWWVEESFKKLFVVASIPFINKDNIYPKLVVLSKHKPILEGETSFIYKTSLKQDNQSFNEIAKLQNSYLYMTNFVVKDKKLKFVGAYPNLNLTKDNEKNK